MPKKNKKLPLRKCILSNEMKEKHDLIRIVRTKEGQVFVDPTGKKNGRGAYVSKDLALVSKAEEDHLLERHLKVENPGQIYQDLKKVILGEPIE